MRVLVTGASGFVGSEVCRQLKAHHHDVIGVHRPGHIWTLTPDDWAADIRDHGQVEAAIGRARPDIVIHLAAESIVGSAEASANACIETNVLGTQYVTYAAKQFGAKCVVATSDKAYGDQGANAVDEKTPLAPRGVYETSKACADYIARMNGASVVRCCNVFGPGDMNMTRLVPRTCHRLLHGLPPELNAGAAMFVREWIPIASAANAYIVVALKGVPGEAYNAPGHAASVFDVAQHLCDVAGVNLAPKEGPAAGFYEIPKQRLSGDSLMALGWSLDEGSLRSHLAKTYEWYKARFT